MIIKMPDQSNPKKRGGARPNTGGKRPNSGRPATGRAVGFSIYCKPDLLNKIDAAASQRGVSRTSIIVEILDKRFS